MGSLTHEMRILSKIRHPCVVTIMGAVVDGRGDNLLVLEYMEHGSLSDLFQGHQLELDGEILKPVIQDAASGLQFLHNFAKPLVHGGGGGPVACISSIQMLTMHNAF